MRAQAVALRETWEHVKTCLKCLWPVWIWGMLSSIALTQTWVTAATVIPVAQVPLWVIEKAVQLFLAAAYWHSVATLCVNALSVLAGRPLAASFARARALVSLFPLQAAVGLSGFWLGSWFISRFSAEVLGPAVFENGLRSLLLLTVPLVLMPLLSAVLHDTSRRKASGTLLILTALGMVGAIVLYWDPKLVVTGCWLTFSFLALNWFREPNRI